VYMGRFLTSSKPGGAVLLVAVAVASLLAGTLVGRYRVFPYPAIAALKHLLAPPAQDNSLIPSDSEYIDRVALFAVAEGSADVVMLGDSIVANGDWTHLSAGLPLANRALPRETIAGLLARLDDVLRLNPQTVYMMIGLNDFLANRTVEDVYRDYMAVLDVLQQENIAVVVQATLLVGTSNPYFNELNDQIDELNGRLAGAAVDRRLVFFDTNAVLAPAGVLNPNFTDDGVHPNYRGHACWAAALRVGREKGWNVERVSSNLVPRCHNQLRRLSELRLLR
jgi:lysophospholipase L1-like esterase